MAEYFYSLEVTPLQKHRRTHRRAVMAVVVAVAVAAVVVAVVAGPVDGCWQYEYLRGPFGVRVMKGFGEDARHPCITFLSLVCSH